jgi:hypothetical protein
MYKKISEQQRDEKREAILWLYLHTKGLIEDFTRFYDLHRAEDLDEIERKLREITAGEDRRKD